MSDFWHIFFFEHQKGRFGFETPKTGRIIYSTARAGVLQKKRTKNVPVGPAICQKNCKKNESLQKNCANRNKMTDFYPRHFHLRLVSAHFGQKGGRVSWRAWLDGFIQNAPRRKCFGNQGIKLCRVPG